MPFPAFPPHPVTISMLRGRLSASAIIAVFGKKFNHSAKKNISWCQDKPWRSRATQHTEHIDKAVALGEGVLSTHLTQGLGKVSNLQTEK